MARNLLLWFLLSAIGSSIAWGMIKSGYPFVLASAEARASLEVSTEQLAELKSARYASDAITFGIVGAVLVAISMLANRFSRSGKLPATRSWLNDLLLLLFGAGLGFVAGAAGGWLGNSFEDGNSWNLDTTTRLMLRSVIVMLPAAVVGALAIFMLERNLKRVGDLLLGSILGVGLTLLLTAVLHGNLTTFEARPPVFPDQPTNRFMFPTVFLLCTSLMTLIMANRKGNNIAVGRA